MGLALFLVIVISFAGLLTTHILLCFRLAKTDPKTGFLALLVPPLAPYFCQGREMGKLPALWLGLAIVYALSLLTGFALG